MAVIGFVATSGRMFAEPMAERLGEHHDVRWLTDWPDSEVDLLWIDWCDEAAVKVTSTPKTCPIVVRLHSYEAFTDFPKEVDWSKVDALVFVAAHVRDHVLRNSAIDGPEIRTIRNGVDLARFEWTERPAPGKRIAWVGGISHKKGPALFLQVAAAIRRWDPELEFHVAGEFLDPRYRAYFSHLVPELGLAEAVHFHGHVPHEEMPAWLAANDFVLSTSPWEGMQTAVAEGISCGLLPLLHRWPGVEEAFAGDGLGMPGVWSTPGECVAWLERYARSEAEQAWERLRALREQLSIEHQLREVQRLVDDLLAQNRAPSVSATIIVSNSERRLRACLESIRGVVDEVVVCVDTRSEGSAEEVAREFTDRVFVEPFPMWMDDPPRIHFGEARNRSLSHATGDWCVVIDGDETLQEGAALRSAIRHAHMNGYDGVGVRVDCWTDQGLAEQAVDVRAFRRSGRIRWHYPVHNQLLGIRRMLASDAVIRSSYEGTGGLQDRVDRAVPALEKLYEEASCDEERIHAAFFLCRSCGVAGEVDGVVRWGQVCRRLCPDRPFAAPFWVWLAMATCERDGLEAGEAVAREGLGHHPDLPDLWHLLASIDLSRWHRAAVRWRGGSKGTTPQCSPQYVDRAARAVELLKLPVVIPGGEGAGPGAPQE